MLINDSAGALGPFTIYGPISKNYDHQLSPIIMSDWLHQRYGLPLSLPSSSTGTIADNLNHSVWQRWDKSIKADGSRIFIDNILQNGIGKPTAMLPSGR
jgi:hypothetical protein